MGYYVSSQCFTTPPFGGGRPPQDFFGENFGGQTGAEGAEFFFGQYNFS